MKEIPAIWACSVCGPLTPDQFYACKHSWKDKDGNRKEGVRLKCRTCSKKAANGHKKRRPDLHAKNQANWRKRNPGVWQLRLKESRARNLPKRVASEKKERRETRDEVLSRYGLGDPKCAICGDDHEEFLVIDHVDGGGNRHRKELKRKSYRFYKWLIQQDFPTGFRVLCHCCNQASSSYGHAPERNYGKFAHPVLSQFSSTKRHQQARRILCLAVYGNYDPKCSCCGLSNHEYLVLDHIGGGGRKHRKELGVRGSGLYAWIIREGFPDGFRVLCYNCNFALGAHGRCPHAFGSTTHPPIHGFVLKKVHEAFNQLLDKEMGESGCDADIICLPDVSWDLLAWYDQDTKERVVALAFGSSTDIDYFIHPLDDLLNDSDLRHRWESECAVKVVEWLEEEFEFAMRPFRMIGCDGEALLDECRRLACKAVVSGVQSD